MLVGFDSYPFTKEIDQTLTPHIGLLAELFKTPGVLDDAEVRMRFEGIPVLEYIWNLSDPRESEKNGVVLFSGDLPVVDQACIANWFSRRVPNAACTRDLWFARFPLAHAFTLIILARRREEFEHLAEFPSSRSKEEQTKYLLRAAWQHQYTARAVPFTVVDVDKECLSLLEERMFTDSVETGRAGNQQWGLDKGTHQNRWNPYVNLPSQWSYQPYEGSDSELQPGPEYSDTEVKPHIPEKRPAAVPVRPRPRKKPKANAS
ncbi:hypothetical protein A0H81_08563 [Grifola frondosa]|uniref:Uncharacterized protein n=1 Tax=Grifola frondosa TaxID=5627 RepID=A0A1C7M424_GRIFR|nr:hypothetical protein A0H81_08563 [Grifola frondosa]